MQAEVFVLFDCLVVEYFEHDPIVQNGLQLDIHTLLPFYNRVLTPHVRFVEILTVLHKGMFLSFYNNREIYRIPLG